MSSGGDDKKLPKELKEPKKTEPSDSDDEMQSLTKLAKSLSLEDIKTMTQSLEDEKKKLQEKLSILKKHSESLERENKTKENAKKKELMKVEKKKQTAEKYKGKMKLFVKLPNGAMMEMVIKKGDSISSLKQKIGKKTGLFGSDKQ